MGPTAAVLVVVPFGKKLKWRDLVGNVADNWCELDVVHVRDTTKFGGSYLGEPLPFMGQVREFAESVCPEEYEAICRVIGLTFTHVIELGAGCKSSADHQVLCEIARYLAEQLHGYVDFCDKIAPDNACAELHTVSWIEDNHEFTTQIGSPAACTWWLNQPNFRMVK